MLSFEVLDIRDERVSASTIVKDTFEFSRFAVVRKNAYAEESFKIVEASNYIHSE